MKAPELVISFDREVNDDDYARIAAAFAGHSVRQLVLPDGATVANVSRGMRQLADAVAAVNISLPLVFRRHLVVTMDDGVTREVWR